MIMINKEVNSNLIKNYKCKEEINEDITINIKATFTHPEKLYEFVIENVKFQSFFIEEIRKIINIMHKMIYKPPYNILFGRINIEKKEKKRRIVQEKIDKFFYDGFKI